MDDAPSGIKFHIKRAESQMGSDSTSGMLKAIEELYYALYARIHIEIGHVQLCDSFRANKGKFHAGHSNMDPLPQPSHLNVIFHACKEVLKANDVCTFLNKEIIQQHQTDYVRWAVDNCARQGYYPVDQLGFRQYILRLVANPSSPAFKQWYGLNPALKSAPGNVLAALSEKYLDILPKEHRGRENEVVKSRVLMSIPDPHTQERYRVMSNREATGALLNGTTVGEFRRIEGTWALKDYAANGRCICFGFCICANQCTRNPDRPCPCSSRMATICANQEIEPQKMFSERYGDLAEAIFEGLCVSKQGISAEDMAKELRLGLELFHEEFLDYRREYTRLAMK